MKTLLATTLGELQSLRPAWDALYRAGDHTLFQSFSWNYLAARVLHQRQLCVSFAESDGGAALIPGIMDGNRICLLGETIFDYADVLASGTPEASREAWSSVRELGLPLSFGALRGGARARRWKTYGFAPKPFVSAPRVRRADTSAGDFGDKHARSRRLIYRLQRAGVELHKYTGAASRLVRHIYERKGQQPMTGGDNLFADPARVEFMVAAAGLNPAACEIYTLESGSCLVAALVCFRDGVVRRFYTIDYDRKWASYSPGVALMFEATQESLAGGLDCDYMTGEQAHKMRYATYCESLFRVEASCEELRQIAGMSVAA